MPPFPSYRSALVLSILDGVHAAERAGTLTDAKRGHDVDSGCSGQAARDYQSAMGMDGRAGERQAEVVPSRCRALTSSGANWPNANVGLAGDRTGGRASAGFAGRWAYPST